MGCGEGGSIVLRFCCCRAPHVLPFPRTCVRGHVHVLQAYKGSACAVQQARPWPTRPPRRDPALARCPSVAALQPGPRSAAACPACRYVNGTHYSRTLEDWLRLHDAARSTIMPLFEQTYGKEQASRCAAGLLVCWVARATPPHLLRSEKRGSKRARQLRRRLMRMCMCSRLRRRTCRAGRRRLAPDPPGHFAGALLVCQVAPVLPGLQRAVCLRRRQRVGGAAHAVQEAVKEGTVSCDCGAVIRCPMWHPANPAEVLLDRALCPAELLRRLSPHSIHAPSPMPLLLLAPAFFAIMAAPLLFLLPLPSCNPWPVPLSKAPPAAF